MDNSAGINNNDVATLSLLGGGYTGYGWGHHGAYASDATNAVRIEGHNKQNAQAQDFISQQISDNADRNRDAANTANNAANFNRLNDKISDQTRFFTNEMNLISRDLADHARHSAECCCEAKLLAVQNQAKTDAGIAEILANQKCDTRVADAVANAQQNAKLDQLLAWGRGGRNRNGTENHAGVDLEAVIKHTVTQVLNDLVDININIENNVGDDDFPPGPPDKAEEGEFKDLPSVAKKQGGFIRNIFKK